MIRKKIGDLKGNENFLAITSWMLGLKNGVGKGLKMLHQMFEGEVLWSFRQLQDKFGLTSKDVHRYLQLRSYLMSHKEWSLLKKQPTPIEDLFINIIKVKKDTMVVSQILKCLNLLMSGSAPDIKGK